MGNGRSQLATKKVFQTLITLDSLLYRSAPFVSPFQLISSDGSRGLPQNLEVLP